MAILDGDKINPERAKLCERQHQIFHAGCEMVKSPHDDGIRLPTAGIPKEGFLARRFCIFSIGIGVGTMYTPPTPFGEVTELALQICITTSLNSARADSEVDGGLLRSDLFCSRVITIPSTSGV